MKNYSNSVNMVYVLYSEFICNMIVLICICTHDNSLLLFLSSSKKRKKRNRRQRKSKMTRKMICL